MVKIKRKVTIKTKRPDDGPIGPETPVGGNGNEPKSNKKWILLVIAAIVVIACVIGFKQLDHSSNNNDGAIPETPPVDSPTVTKTGSVQTKENQPEADTIAPKGENKEKSETKEPNASSPSSNTKDATEKEPTAHNQNTSVQTTTTERNISSGSVEDEARQVIRGIYGNGSVRKQRLGDRYSEIQSKVNDMYRNGLVH